jgi:hypothetical protein
VAKSKDDTQYKKLVAFASLFHKPLPIPQEQFHFCNWQQQANISDNTAFQFVQKSFRKSSNG